MALSAAGILTLQLEQVEREINVLAEADSTLDKYINENAGKVQKVSKKSYRVNAQTQLPGAFGLVDLDSASVGFPDGGQSQWSEGTVTPIASILPATWTKLAELVTEGDLAIKKAVATTVADLAKALKKKRDQMLQTDGTGKIGVVSGSPSGLVITLVNDPFGSRLIDVGQTIGVWNGTALRGTAKVTAKADGLGTQTITVDAVPASTGNGDIIRIQGCVDGAPVAFNGIPYFHNTSATGSCMGIDRSAAANNFILANGVDAGGASPTQPMFDLAIDQIRQRLGVDSVKELILHAHPAVPAAYKQMGYNLQTIPLDGGKGGNLDLGFGGKMSYNGHPFVENIHASVSRVDFVRPKDWGKVTWGGGTFWYTLPDGTKVFPRYNGTSGTITAGMDTYLVDARQYYNMNAKACTSITNLKVTANYGS